MDEVVGTEWGVVAVVETSVVGLAIVLIGTERLDVEVLEKMEHGLEREGQWFDEECKSVLDPAVRPESPE